MVTISKKKIARAAKLAAAAAIALGVTGGLAYAAKRRSIPSRIYKKASDYTKRRKVIEGTFTPVASFV